MSRREFPPVPDNISLYLRAKYASDVSFDVAFDDFLDAYRLSPEEKEEMDEKELEQASALKEAIKKQAYDELKQYLIQIKQLREELKKIRDNEDISDELREILNRKLVETKFSLTDLGDQSPASILMIIENLQDDVEDAYDEMENDENLQDYEDEEYRQEQEDYQKVVQEHRPVSREEIMEDLQEIKEEFQPYEFQPEQLPGFDLERQVWPSDGIRDRPVVDETAERENEFYEAQILRLQQLILADPENTNNEHYYNLLSQIREKIKENQGIIHDHVNYHIGPEDMGIEIFPYEKNSPLLNPAAAYQNVINRRGYDLTRENLREDPYIQSRINRIYMEAKHQFAPQKGFVPQVSRQLWDSMVEGKEVGWSKAYEGNVLGYDNGLFGSKFSQRTGTIEDEVHKEMEEQIIPNAPPPPEMVNKTRGEPLSFTQELNDRIRDRQPDRIERLEALEKERSEQVFEPRERPGVPLKALQEQRARILGEPIAGRMGYGLMQAY